MRAFLHVLECNLNSCVFRAKATLTSPRNAETYPHGCRHFRVMGRGCSRFRLELNVSES